MADWDMNAVRAGSRLDLMPGQRMHKTIRLAGGALSLALIAGLGHWGYKLAMRQIHGIPVIAAPEGPARVAPEIPGGELAQYQGMAVNAIAALGEAAPTTERMMLAPTATELGQDDVASESLQASDGTALAEPATSESRQVVPSETLAAMQPADGQLSEPLPDGPVDQIDDPALLQGDGSLPLAPEDLVAADVPGVATSPFPPVRPADGAVSGDDVVAEAAAAAVAAALSPPANIDLDPAAITPGTELVQIGSFDTEATAKLEWDKTVARYGALMDGKRRVIQKAESGGRSFYRLRVQGFAARDDAVRFCAVLKANGPCVPAQVRG